MGSVSSPRALPIYIFTLAHGFIPLLDTPLCVPPWAKRPMIAHTYHNKECTALPMPAREGRGSSGIYRRPYRRGSSAMVDLDRATSCWVGAKLVLGLRL